MERIEEMFTQINATMQETNRKLDHIVTEMEELKKENRRLMEKLLKQEETIRYMERECSKKNLVIKEIEDRENETIDETKEKVMVVMKNMEVKLDSKTDIDEEQRMGKLRQETIRPIILKLLRREKKWIF